ncbi:MAG: hypothetical protein PHX77_05960 [Candidatus Bipolaricaulis sp.]|nr:hypothetical protein [Candidatus Bipolaricaulis sp.]MDD5645586.1 hypothetical protein [Candidatus Bipolaricaulis sp.]
MARGSRVASLCLILLGLLAGLLSGCRSSKGPAEYIFGLADVQSIEVRMVDEYPGRLTAVVRGSMRDTCTRIESVRQDVHGNNLVLTVTTERPVDDVCAQALTPFEVTTPLRLEGLPSGEYTVTANGVSTSFKWTGTVAVPR